MKININIDNDWNELKKEKGWTHKEIYGAGILAKQDNPQLIKRIQRLEERQDRIIRRLNEM